MQAALGGSQNKGGNQTSATGAVRREETRLSTKIPRVLVNPTSRPPIQMARGAILSLRNPPIIGARVRAIPQPSQCMDIYRPRRLGGARSATYLLAVGTRVSSPNVR